MFCNRSEDAEALAGRLREGNLPAAHVSAQRTQLERMDVLNALRDLRRAFWVATGGQAGPYSACPPCWRARWPGRCCCCASSALPARVRRAALVGPWRAPLLEALPLPLTFTFTFTPGRPVQGAHRCGN